MEFWQQRDKWEIQHCRRGNKRVGMPSFLATLADPNVVYILLHNKLEVVPWLRFESHCFCYCKRIVKGREKAKILSNNLYKLMIDKGWTQTFQVGFPSHIFRINHYLLWLYSFVSFELCVFNNCSGFSIWMLE